MVLSAKAQDIKIGPRIGLTLSNVKFEKSMQSRFESFRTKVGFQAGAFARVGIAGFYLQPELLFSTSGGEIAVLDVDGGYVVDQPYYVVDLSFQNLSVPVLFGKKFAKIARVNVGPTFNYLLKAEDSRNGDVKDDYSSATVGFQVGAGVDLGPLILDIKYDSSLSKLGDTVDDINVDQRQSMWILALGFSFL